MTAIIKVLVAVWLLLLDAVHSQYLSGDFVIGGIFPVNYRNKVDPKRCSVEPNLPGFLMLEELIFAVLKVNDDKCVMRNATLGFAARDHCNSQSIAIRTAMFFFEDNKDVKVGVISHAQFKHKLIQVLSGILEAIDPPVPYLNAAPLQDEVLNSPNEFEVTAPTSRGWRGVIGLMKHFQWDYVIVVYQEDEEGEAKLTSFENAIVDEYISIARKFGMKDFADTKPLIESMKSFTESKTINVVLLMTPAEASYNLTMEAAVQNLDLVWLTDEESWDRNRAVTARQLRSMGGLLNLAIPPPKTMDEFKTYLKEIDFQTHISLNPFYTREIGAKLMSIAHQYNGVITDAVYAIAYAIDKRQNDTQTSLREYLKKVRFVAPSGRKFSFTEDNRLQYTNYAIYNLQKVKAAADYAEVGYVSLADDEQAEVSMLVANASVRWGSRRKGGVPKSRCSEPCSPGWFAVQSPIVSDKSCFTCEKCPLGEESTSVNARFCFPVPWKQLPALITYGVVGVLLLLILFLLVVFCRVPNACEIRHCTNATLHLLCALTLTALLPVVLFLPVKPLFCNIYNGAYTLCLSIPLSILISQSKCLRDRIRHRRTEGGQRGCACDPRPAVYTVLFLLSLMVAGLFIFYFPSEVLSVDQSGSYSKECSAHSDNHFLILFFYVVFLASILLLVSVTSLKRELGEFDTPAVCYCVLFFFILCLLYMFSRHFFQGQLKIIALAAINFLHAINFLFCIFVPKLCMMSYQDLGNRPKISFLSPYELSQAQEKVSERLSNTLPRDNQSPLLPQKVKVQDESCKENGETTHF